jgi:GT2 family glycosyltransferase
MNDSAVDIVISTYGRGDAIDATIASLRKSTVKAFTLWILDQNEDAQTSECVLRHAAADERIRYLRVPVRGISATRNHGAALGQAPIIAFTNDDCTLDGGWLQALLSEFEACDTVAVFGRVLPGPRPAGPCGDVVLALKTSAKREVFRGSRFNLGFGHGHNMAIRRQYFAALGGFDSALGSGERLGSWDERDLGYRLLRSGGTIVYAPNALAYHCHWQTWRGARSSYIRYGIGVGVAAAKYLRCGDLAAVYLIFEWIYSQGLRQVLSGAFKWRSWGKVMVGLTQFVYPWVGLVRGFREHTQVTPPIEPCISVDTHRLKQG